ncbi:MAG: pyridoxamine 5'-phosphate oxidase [Flavobacteriales bacterium]
MNSYKDRIEKHRHEYDLSEGFNIENASDNPFEQFDIWLKEAIDNNVNEPNAMTLATVSKEGKPSNRIVLLRKITEESLVFYTNYKSQKGLDIANNPNVCVNFFWPELQRQIKVEGTAEKVPESMSDNYFNERPRESQLGAWASPQSSPITKRHELEKNMEEMAEKFKEAKVPRPNYWGGYRILPKTFEFWQGRKNRMHDRIRYTRSNKNDWEKTRLAP